MNTNLNIVAYRGFIKYANYIFNDVMNEMGELEKEKEVISYNEIIDKYTYLREALSKVSGKLSINSKIEYEMITDKVETLLKNKSVRKYIKLKETKIALDNLMQLCIEKEEDLERAKCKHPIWYFDKTNNTENISLSAICPKCGKKIRVPKTGLNEEFLYTIKYEKVVAKLFELNKKTGKKYVTHGFKTTNKSLKDIEELFQMPKSNSNRIVKELLKK